MISTTATIFHATFLLYCLYKLVRYGRRKGKWELKWHDRQRWLMTLAILSPLMTMGRVVLTQAVIVIGKVAPLGEIGNDACKISFYFSMVLFYYYSGECFLVISIRLPPFYVFKPFLIGILHYLFTNQKHFSYLINICTLTLFTITSLCINNTFIYVY